MGAINIDLKVLEKLWNGDLHIAERCHPQDKEYQEMVRELDVIHTQLLEVVTEDSQVGELLERYEQQSSTIAEREHLEAFKMGVALALSMVMETLLEK